MTYNPHTRFSMADMFGKCREYMLVLDSHMIYVTVTHDKLLEIQSNFTDQEKPNAEEWMQEVAADISNAYGGKISSLYDMIKAGL